jgi:hypothetical protein
VLRITSTPGSALKTYRTRASLLQLCARRLYLVSDIKAEAGARYVLPVVLSGKLQHVHRRPVTKLLECHGLERVALPDVDHDVLLVGQEGLIVSGSNLFR